MNIKVLLTALTLSLSSPFLFAQTTLIKNIQGYTLDNQELKQFNAIQFTDDKVDKIFKVLFFVTLFP